MSAIRTSPIRPTYSSEALFPVSVETYHQLIEIGRITPDDPVELLEGTLAFKMPKKPHHRTSVLLAQMEIAARLPGGWHYQPEQPITLGDSEPEPDGAVVRGGIRDHLEGHPSPPDIALVLEVADATRDRDRGLKGRVYARANIPCYWILNLRDGYVEVYADPDPAAAPEPYYRSRTAYARGQAVPLAIAGVACGEIAVDALLPPAER